MYPILFEFGSLTIFSLWVCIAAGFIVSSFLFVRLAKRRRIAIILLAEKSIFLFLWTLLCARLIFIIFHFDLYFSPFDFSRIFKLLALWDKGLSFWGAILGWSSGVWFLLRKEEDPAARYKLFDCMIPSLLVGMVLGNLGAFLDGINYGVPTSLPWGVVFKSAHVKYIAPIHPTQLYAALSTALCAGTLFFLLRKFRDQFPGLVSSVGIFVYSIFRFAEEFARGDETVKLFDVIRFPFVTSGLGILAGGYLLYRFYVENKKNDPTLTLKRYFSLAFGRKIKKTNPEAILESIALPQS